MNSTLSGAEELIFDPSRGCYNTFACYLFRTQARVIEGIADQHESFRGKTNVDLLEQVLKTSEWLLTKPYHLSRYILTLHRHCIYHIAGTGDKRRMEHREYEPTGYKPDAHRKCDLYLKTHIIKIPPDFHTYLFKHDPHRYNYNNGTKRRNSSTDYMYLFHDGSAPWLSKKDLKNYIERLKVLYEFNKKEQTNGSNLSSSKTA